MPNNRRIYLFGVLAQKIWTNVYKNGIRSEIRKLNNYTLTSYVTGQDSMTAFQFSDNQKTPDPNKENKKQPTLPLTIFFKFVCRHAVLMLIPVIVLGSYYSLTNYTVNQAPGETGLAALSLLKTGAIANPYIIPTGPTAHTAPGTVAVVAGTYSLFNGNTISARIALSLLATALYVASAFAVILYCRTMRFSWPSVTAALILTCILPVRLYDTVITYRQWDQPISALLLTLLLLVWAKSENTGKNGYTPALVIGALGGFGSLFAPALPLVATVAEIALGKRTREWRPTLLGIVLIVLCLLPWGLRNQHELGKFILSRSNFPLELAVGNHDRATGVFDMATIPPVHPHNLPAAASRLADVGEVAYMDEMRNLAFSWITAHPAEFVKLSMRRAWLLFLPNELGRDPLFNRVKLAVFWGTGLLSIGMLVLLFVLRHPVMKWIACIGLPLAPYVLTHTSTRYIFPIFFVQVCLIATGIDALRRIYTKKRLIYSGSKSRC